jgi:hypothetical protein
VDRGAGSGRPDDTDTAEAMAGRVNRGGRGKGGLAQWARWRGVRYGRLQAGCFGLSSIGTMKFSI